MSLYYLIVCLLNSLQTHRVESRTDNPNITEKCNRTRREYEYGPCTIEVFLQFFLPIAADRSAAFSTALIRVFL